MLFRSINADFNALVKQPDTQEKLLAVGIDARGSTPAEYQAFINRETERWGKILRDRNAKPE